MSLKFSNMFLLNGRQEDAYKETRAWKKYIIDNDVIFDVGTNQGLYAAQLAAYFPNSTIHCFDPMKQIVESNWKKNMELNGITNTIFYGFGFSNEDKKSVKFLMPKFDPIENTEVYGYLYEEDYADRPQLGELRKLDNFVFETKIQPNFIKIDAEGAELDIVTGGIETIKNCRVLVIEAPDKLKHGFRFENTIKIHEILTNLGFLLMDKTARYNRIYVNLVRYKQKC